MTSPPTVLTGVIHGKIIELDQAPGLSDCQAVIVTVQSVGTGPAPLPSGEGIRHSAGGWEEDAAELDRFLEWNRQQRKRGRPEMEP